MESLAEIKKQIAQLEKKAEALIKAEAAQAITKIKELMDRHGVTAADLGLAGKGGKKVGAKRAAAKAGKGAVTSVGVPMYRDPTSGKTWTGRGKPPTWIATAKDRSKFLIGASATAGDENMAVGEPRSDKVKAKPKRAPKGVAVRAARKAAVRRSAKIEAPASTASSSTAGKKAGTGKKPSKKVAAAPLKATKAPARKKAKRGALGADGVAPAADEVTRASASPV